METQKNILIIDDHEDTVALLEDFLKDNNYTTERALTGSEGLQKIAGTRPDLVILDMVLPDMSGAEVCTELRSQPSTRDIPIIVCTAHKVSIEDKMKGFRAGVDDFLVRPFELAELLVRMEAVLRRAQVKPKADLLADLQSMLSTATPPTPPPPNPTTIGGFTPPKPSAPKTPQEPQSLGLIKRFWQVLNHPSQVFEKAKYSHDFFTALFFVVITPIIASLTKVTSKAGSFDNWIGYFSLGIVTNLVMWLATAGLIHITLPFLGVHLTMRRSLSVSGLAWAPRLLGALCSAFYNGLSYMGLAVQVDDFTSGIDIFLNKGMSPWLQAIGHIGLFDFWSAWITLVAIWSISKSEEKKWTTIPIMIGITCLIFGAFTHY